MHDAICLPFIPLFIADHWQNNIGWIPVFKNLPQLLYNYIGTPILIIHIQFFMIKFLVIWHVFFTSLLSNYFSFVYWRIFRNLFLLYIPSVPSCGILQRVCLSSSHLLLPPPPHQTTWSVDQNQKLGSTTAGLEHQQEQTKPASVLVGLLLYLSTVCLFAGLSVICW